MEKVSLLVAMTAVALLVGCGPAETPRKKESPSPQSGAAGSRADSRDATPSETAENVRPGVADSPDVADGRPSDHSETAPVADENIRGQLAALGGDARDARREAKGFFDAMDEQGVEQFLANMHDESAEVRRGAAFGLLGKLDPHDPRMADAFTAALSDEDRRVRIIAVQAIGQFPDDVAARAVPRLVEMLNPDRQERAIRSQVARLLGQKGPAVRESLPALIASVKTDPDRSVRAAALAAVLRVAGTPEAAVPVLVAALRDDGDAAVRRSAAMHLGYYGPAASAAVPALTTALEDEDESVRRAAKSALGRIGPSQPGEQR